MLALNCGLVTDPSFTGSDLRGLYIASNCEYNALSMESQPAAFLAYASGKPALKETLEIAAAKIQESGVADLRTWESLRIGGRVIVTAICEAIDSCELLIADLTVLNPNVLFELGFAIARKKRVWLLLDDSQARARSDFERFQLLASVGYRVYNNSLDIVRQFFEDQPYASLAHTVYRDIFDVPVRHPPSKLFYLKSEIQTEASIKMSRRVSQARLGVLVDDPAEMRLQSLSWYARNTNSALGVLAHLLSTDHQDALFHNAKLSLIAGIAFGFGKSLMMLAHEPFISPLDYRDLLKTHATAAQCEQHTSEWVSQLEQRVAETSVAVHEYHQQLKAQTELQEVTVGDPVAEQEVDTLSEYFVITATYNEALRSKHSIVVGRKGTGKTAMLYQLAHELSIDRRNSVCIIKPVAYELEGILRTLRQAIQKSEQGYLIESLWKFLVYTELAKTVYDELRSRPSFIEPEAQELQLLQFVDANASIILPEFSIRLESAVNRLQSVDQVSAAEGQRFRISELLHADLLPRLRAVLGHVLTEKNSVSILVDNLDKAWDQRSDLSTLSQLLFGLLGVSGRIAQEFEKAGVWRQPVNVSLILFLRSDIYIKVVTYAKERDKLPTRFIAWDEPELLLRVIEERFARSGALIDRPIEVWGRYFCATVRGVPIREYLTSVTLPRPRDLIYFVRSALDHAVNAGHVRIEEADFLAAEMQYSRYALDALVVEGSTDIDYLEKILYEFAGRGEIVDISDIGRAVASSGSTQDVRRVADALVELTFLGIEVQEDRFEFLFSETESPKFWSMARRLVEGKGTAGEGPRFRIAPSFHSYLEIQTTRPT